MNAITQAIAWIPLPEDPDLKKAYLLTDGATTAIGMVIGRHAYDQSGRIRGFHPTHYAEVPIPTIGTEDTTRSLPAQASTLPASTTGL